MSKEHEVLVSEKDFDAVRMGEKRAELLRGDGYLPGDRVVFKDWYSGKDTGVCKRVETVVTHVQYHDPYHAGIRPGYALLSLSSALAPNPDNSDLPEHAISGERGGHGASEG